MPYLQPATANYFGFSPAGDVLGMNVYQVSSSATTGADPIHPGDVVCHSTLGNSSPVVRRTTGGTSTDAGVYVGVAASYVPALGGSTSADPRVHTSQNVLVYDHPDQVFYGCDTTSGVIGVAGNLGKSFCVLSTGAVGSTGPSDKLFRSVQAISGVSASSGSGNGYRFRVIGLHPIEASYSTETAATASAGTNTRKYLLVPALPFRNRRDAGIITT